MIRAIVHDDGVELAIRAIVTETTRATETALDKTAYDIRDSIRAEMKHVFDKPVRYTLNSLKVRPTQNHNMRAFVWFKEPDRMGQHYLVPQVEGGQRKYKGFERALDNTKMVPGRGARMTKAGNISPGQIRQVLSVLGRAEMTAGYSANMTARSSVRNKSQRDYVYLPRGSARGKLPPGVYERVSQKRRGIGAKQRKTISRFGTYQKGKTRGKISQVVRARGLRAIMVKGKQHSPVKPRLPFYQIAGRVHSHRFSYHLDRMLRRYSR